MEADGTIKFNQDFTIQPMIEELSESMFDQWERKAEISRRFVRFTLMFCMMIALLLAEGLFENKVEASVGNVVYVDNTAIGAGDGSSWDDAYTNLQMAIEAAEEGDQVWIATGIYIPTLLMEGSEDLRSIHFHMKNGVEIYGGFAGDEDSTTFDLRDRDFAANETILSGDRNQDDDASDFSTKDENAYHVFYHADNIVSLNETAVLDGVTISGGNANDPDYHNSGGGMYNDNNDPTIRNVTFKNNRALNFGGALYNHISNVDLSHVRMMGNIAGNGGGLFSENSKSEWINLIISGNNAISSGGGLYLKDDRSTLVNVLVSGNDAKTAGGIYAESGDLTLVNITISGNKGVNNTGGIYFPYDADNVDGVTLYNSIVCGNNGKFAPDYLGNVKFENSLNAASSTGSCLDARNIILLPASIFVNPSNGDYRLRDSSPAINAADAGIFSDGGILSHVKTDLEGKPRFINDGLDAGAYESSLLSVNASANPEGTGTAEIYEFGPFRYGHAPITLTATPNEGYEFVNWTLADGTSTGQVVSEESVISYELSGSAVTLYANFAALVEVSATSAVDIEGTVAGGGNFAIGREITVSAIPGEGYRFVNWTEADVEVSTDASYSFEVTGARALVAHFELISYEVSVAAAPAEGGSVEGAGDYEHGSEVTVTGEAEAGYAFVNWTEADVEVSTDASYSFVVNGERALIAHFELNSYEVSVAAAPAEGGSVEGAGDYERGSEVTVTGEAEAGYAFVNWTEADVEVSTDASYSFVVNGERALIGNFKKLPPSYTGIINPTVKRCDADLCKEVEVDQDSTFEFEGWTFEIPMETWQEPYEIKINNIIDSGEFNLPDPFIMLSYVIEVKSSLDVDVLLPITLSAAFDQDLLPEGMIPVIQYYDEDTNEWVNTDATIDGNAISIKVKKFATFAVLVVNEDEAAMEAVFSDMAGHWAEQDVLRAWDKGLVQGYPDGEFKPDESVTRAQFMMMLFNLLDRDKIISDKLNFKDKADIPDYAIEAMKFAISEGILHGYPDGTLRPNQEITREEMAVVVARALELPLHPEQKTGFRDDNRIENYSKSAVQAAVAAGYIQGRSENLFQPKETATRAEAAVVILRIFENQV
ncbi:S-layer homology domain-containing protein [Paenibacillus sp. J5C_2022]|uniref:InlB B-repeat-containing protein n=1 Tax=Paenibacillus sp. J5C2022 TaxID=2977129 RepID=UPI0021D25FED|nr:S-layer homology domain-containing protein [Paenibacillus sp. J5C2022]MCU6711951.1 S-layer homology domain-containing protein [Paenibacillus sp. J5C2022]